VNNPTIRLHKRRSGGPGALSAAASLRTRRVGSPVRGFVQELAGSLCWHGAAGFDLAYKGE